VGAIECMYADVLIRLHSIVSCVVRMLVLFVIVGNKIHVLRTELCSHYYKIAAYMTKIQFVTPAFC